jgi:hypothetical protein
VYTFLGTWRWLCAVICAATEQLSQAQRAKLGDTQKADAICDGSGSYGPKPNGNKMADIRSATAKAQALAKS